MPVGVAVAVPFDIPQVGLVIDVAILGLGITLTVIEEVLLQPFVVPVTVYVVFVVGETVRGLLVPKPSLQTYDVAPDAFNEVLSPAHMELLDADMVTLGIA